MNWGAIAAWVQLITRPPRLRRPVFDLRQPPKPVAVESQTNALPERQPDAPLIYRNTAAKLEARFQDGRTFDVRGKTVTGHPVESKRGESMKNGDKRTLVQVTGFLSLIAQGLAGRVPDHVREEAYELRDKVSDLLNGPGAEKDVTLGDLPLTEFPATFHAVARFSLINHIAVRALRQCDRYNVPVISTADGNARRAVEMIVMLTYKDEQWLKEHEEDIRAFAMRQWT